MLAAFLALVILYLLIDFKYGLYNTKTHRWYMPTEHNKVGYVLVAILLICWFALLWLLL
jgi:hypothetical protein